MTLAIDATAGGSAANSFVTLVEAQAYMDARLNGSAWGAAAVDDQNRALVEATRELSAKAWKGNRTTSTQALAWPRAFVPDPDAAWGAGSFNYDTTIVPTRVKHATCELAFQFLKAGTTDLAALDPAVEVVRKQVDVLATEYARPGERPQGLARFPSVLRFIAPLLDGTPNSARVRHG